MHSHFRSCFRHVLTYSSIIQEHTYAYSEPSVSLAYSKPWHISITKHIQTLRYIHNTILNIFTKAQSCTFDTVLNAPVFYRCYLTSRVTLRSQKTLRSQRLYFRHTQKTKMLYLGIFGLEFKKAIVIFGINGLKFFWLQVWCKIKILKFETKNALFEYFWPKMPDLGTFGLEFKKRKLLSYLKLAPLNLSNCKISWNNKNT